MNSISLAQKLSNKSTAFTAEITPPKGAGIKKLIRNAELLKDHVDAINLTDCQRALVRMSSLAACRVLIDHELEPVFQLTCRDRNSISLQADLMGAAALGIQNLLCLTGDPVKVGDSPKSKSVFEFESTRLLELVGKLQRGVDGEGHKMNAPTRFFVGAVVNPTLKGGSSQLSRMEKKVEHGARYFQTQANYDIPDYVHFLMKAAHLKIPILAGILVLHSAEIAKYIHENIPGIRIPEELMRGFETAPDQLSYGIDYALRTMREVAPHCAGFHLMTIRREELIPDLRRRFEGGQVA